MAMIQTTITYQIFGHALALVMPKNWLGKLGLKPNTPQILEGGLEGSEARGRKWVEGGLRGFGPCNLAHQMGSRGFPRVLGRARNIGLNPPKPRVPNKALGGSVLVWLRIFSGQWIILPLLTCSLN